MNVPRPGAYKLAPRSRGGESKNAVPSKKPNRCCGADTDMSERASALAAGGVVRATGRRYALSFDAAGKGYTREPDQQHAPGLINRTVTHQP
jgi:hypothetical protein